MSRIRADKRLAKPVHAYFQQGVFMTELRAATAKDAAAIAAIYAPYVATNAVSFEDTAPTVDEMKARITEHNGRYPWIVAVDEASRVVLGYAYAKPLRPGQSYRYAAEVAVYAAGDLEGKGIRRALLQSVIATLTEQNFTQAILTLLTPNDKLIQLFEASGFRRAGQFREVCYKNGQWHDVGLWQRDLADAAVPPEELISFKKTGVIKN
jgi:phosphinothricin acetyltransferase